MKERRLVRSVINRLASLYGPKYYVKLETNCTGLSTLEMWNRQMKCGASCRYCRGSQMDNSWGFPVETDEEIGHVIAEGRATTIVAKD